MLNKTIELLSQCLQERLNGSCDVTSEAVLADWAEEEGLLVLAQTLRAKQNPPKILPMSAATKERRSRIETRLDFLKHRALMHLHRLMVAPKEDDDADLSRKEYESEMQVLKKFQAYERRLLGKKWNGKYR